MPKNPDKKTLWNGNIYENYFLKFSKSICQYVKVTCICTPTANTTGKHAVTHRGTVHNSFAGCGTYSPLPDPWHGTQAVGWTGKISHLLQANIFQAIFMRNLEGRLWHIWSDQEKIAEEGCGGTVVQDALTQLLCTKQSCEAVSIEAGLPDAGQSQMWSETKDVSLPSILHSHEIWITYLLKFLQNLPQKKETFPWSPKQRTLVWERSLKSACHLSYLQLATLC